MHYQEMVNTIPEPWRQFLRKTYLLPSNDDVVLLVVPEHERPMYSSLELLSVIYPVALKLHPNMVSLAVVSGNEYDLVKDEKLEIVDVRFN